mgnify:CR=1 FL=1
MDCFYKEKFDGIDVDSIQSQEDFEKSFRSPGRVDLMRSISFGINGGA